VLAAQDPLDPEQELFWAGPGGLRKAAGQSSDAAKSGGAPDTPYSLKPELALAPATQETEEPNEGVRNEPNSLNLSTTLKRPAGPVKPGIKVPEPSITDKDLSEPEVKRIKRDAVVFGYGSEPMENQIKIDHATEGFRKLYVGALGAHTTERSLEAYFGQFGKVKFCQVLRDRATNQTKGFGFVTMAESSATQQILSRSVHVVDTRTIRVSLTHSARQGHTPEWRPPNPRRHEEKVELVSEVAGIEVREGRVYVGPLPHNCSPNILADHFSTYGPIATSNVSRAVHNTMKKNFGLVAFTDTMPVKRVLQNPRHYVNEQFVEIALSKFAMELFLGPTTLWLWSLDWSVSKDDLVVFFNKNFGQVYRAMHIFNPLTGDKKGYGFVDFVDEEKRSKALRNCGVQGRPFMIKGQQGFFGRQLPRQLKRDLMYMEDRFGNLLLRHLFQKVPDSGTWGGGQALQETLKGVEAKTITCKLPKQMLPVVVGEDGKIVTDIARDSKTKISLLKSTPQEDSVLFHIIGSVDNCKTAQYMMQMRIKEKLARGGGAESSRTQR